MIAKDTWVRLIKDFEESPFPEDIVSRELDLPLRTKTRRAITLLGPRRAGKTYSLFLLIKRLIGAGIDKTSIIYVNFESLELDGARLKDLEGFLEAYFAVYPENVKRKTWFFLDEVQKIDGWESFARSLLDKGKHVYISGSSSRLLSKEVASLLRGRGIAFEVFPLSFREFLAFNGIRAKKFLSTSEKAKIINLLDEYISWGSYPEVALEESPAIKKRILKEILDVTIQRDIVERYRVRNEKLLKLLVKALANSKEFSVHKFFNFLQSNSVKVSKNTLYSYLGALNDCFAVFSLKKFSLSYKEEEQSIPKIYFVDSGLLLTTSLKQWKQLSLLNC